MLDWGHFWLSSYLVIIVVLPTEIANMIMALFPLIQSGDILLFFSVFLTSRKRTLHLTGLKHMQIAWAKHCILNLYITSKTITHAERQELREATHTYRERYYNWIEIHLSTVCDLMRCTLQRNLSKARKYTYQIYHIHQPWQKDECNHYKRISGEHLANWPIVIIVECRRQLTNL